MQIFNEHKNVFFIIKKRQIIEDKMLNQKCQQSIV